MKKFEKISYGLGVVPESISITVISLYLLFFCTDVLGLDSGVVGIVILLINLFDIITDLVVMNFADKHPTKFGDYRLWVLNAIPMSVCLLLIFINPSFLNSKTAKLIWVSVFYFLLTPVFETGYLCPYISLRARLSSNQKEQTQIASIVSVFDNLSQLITIVLISLLVTDKSFEIKYWRIFIFIIVAIMIICSIISFSFTREHIVVKENNTSFKNGFKLLIKDKSVLRLVGILGVVYIPWMAFSSLLTYFCTYNLGHEEWFSYVAIFSLIICVLISFITYPLASKLGKKTFISVCAIVLLISSILFMFVNNIWLILLFCALKDFGQIGIYICALSYLPEIDEKFIKTTHLKNTGLITGTVNALTKIGGSVGTYLASLILSLGKYDSALSIQSDNTLTWIKYGLVVAYFICSLIILMINRKGINGNEKAV